MYSNLCNHNPPTLQTDRQTTCDSNTTLCTKVHCAVKIKYWSYFFSCGECCCRVVFSQLTVSSSASCSLIRPLLSSVSGHESTMWPIVCCWLQSFEFKCCKAPVVQVDIPWLSRQWEPWCSNRLLLLNTAKTEVLWCSTSQRQHQISPDMH